MSEEDCQTCDGTGKDKVRKEYWGGFARCRYCRNGKVLTPESSEQLDLIEFWLRRRFEDDFEPKHSYDNE